MKLNLTVVDSSQERILAYLQENASESLANKINNGTPFTKDNIQLINKKDLNGFMSYATTEARKLAKNGACYACIDDSTVFGWAIHYFEEESIEGNLYNLDGTEYKPVTTKATSKQKSFVAPTTKVEPPKPQQEQRSLWDMLESTTEPVESKNDNTPITIEPVIPPIQTTESKETTTTVELSTEPIFDTTNIDEDTGEVLDTIPIAEPVIEQMESSQPIKQEEQTEPQIPTFDRETMIYLATLLDNKIEIA